MSIRVVAILTHAADNKGAETAAVAERAALLQTVGRGSNITSNNQQYQILTGVRAVESLPQEEPQQTLTRMGGGKLIETNGTFVVFTVDQQSAASVTSVNGTSYPTAFNPATGGIGIVPGTLNVKLKNMGQAAAIAADHGLEVVRVFAHLKTAFFRVKTGRDVVAATATLTTDARVVSGEAEVIEHRYIPH